MNDYTTYSDDQLVALLLLGNEGAFTEIYRRYWRQVYATAFQFEKDAQTAEDIVQQVFLSLFEKREILGVIQSISAYLAAAAKYKILDYCAKKKRRSRLLDNYQNNVKTGLANIHEPLPDDKLHTRIMEELLHKKTQELPDRTRVIFIRSRHELLSNQQIASEMNVSVKTVEKHITIAIKTLRLSLHRLTNSLFTAAIILISSAIY